MPPVSRFSARNKRGFSRATHQILGKKKTASCWQSNGMSRYRGAYLWKRKRGFRVALRNPPCGCSVKRLGRDPSKIGLAQGGVDFLV